MQPCVGDEGDLDAAVCSNRTGAKGSSLQPYSRASSPLLVGGDKEATLLSGPPLMTILSNDSPL